MSNPSMPDRAWQEAVKEAARYFPEWARERKRKPRQEHQELNDDEVMKMVHQIERDRFGRKMKF